MSKTATLLERGDNQYSELLQYMIQSTYFLATTMYETYKETGVPWTYKPGKKSGEKAQY